MLHLKCKGQEMKVDVDERIADKYINANKVHFEFCERWAGMIITAQFTQKQDGVDKTYDVVVDELTNMVTMPNEIVAGEVHISAFGVDPVTGVRITSIPVKKTIDKSGFVGDGETPVPPTPDLYAQLLEQFGNGVPPSTGAYKQLVTDKSGAIVWDNLRVMAGTNHGSVRTSAAAAEQTLGYKLGNAAFAANMETEASGQAAFAAGFGTEAIGKNSFAEGNRTIANGENQHVQGKFNVKDTANKYAHIVGNGMTDAKRANAHTLDWDGNAWFKGDVYVGGDDQSKGEKLVTKSELDAAVAAGGGGSGEGGGGGLPTGGDPNMMLVTDADGNAKWEARTHWKEEGGIDILPEMTLEGEDGDFSILEPFANEIVVGETYTVTYNGTDYTCTAFPLQEGEGAPIMPSVGNQTVIGGEDTGEPFFIAYVPPEIVGMVGAYGIAMDVTGAASATVRIRGDGVAYHKLDPGYLPIPMTDASTEILPETAFEMWEGYEGEFWTDVPLSAMPAVGETYTVTWNSVDYECAVSEADVFGEGVNFPVAGDVSLFETGEPTGSYPFVIYFVPSEYVVDDTETVGAIAIDGSTEATIRIRKKGGIKIAAEALDLDWIPKLENVGETIFKTSVDDVLTTTIDVTLSDKVAVGDKVIVIYDGVFYEQTAFEYEGVLCIGSAELLAGGFGTQVTGIPVAMGEMDGQTIIKVMTTGAETHTVELYKSGDSQQVAKEKLPNAFLPDTSALHVVITQNDDDSYSSSHNVSDIYKAYLENRPVFCSYDGNGNALAIKIFQLIQIGSYEAVFGRFDGGENQTFTLRSIDGFRVNYRANRYTEAT